MHDADLKAIAMRTDAASGNAWRLGRDRLDNPVVLVDYANGR